jgi:hypothetical protein
MSAKLFQPPRYDTIVEPFAGSAGYSLRYPGKNVVLCEIDPYVFGVWSYLLRVDANEIISLPDLGPDQSVDDLDIPQEARWLIGFWINVGPSGPRKKLSRWARDKTDKYWCARTRARLARQVDAIKHWKIYNCSYEDCPVAGPATWFIDPPYQLAGKYYRFGSSKIDYDALGRWCRSREGQVIVCENDGASWLPFRPLASVKTARNGRLSKEAIWTNDDP